MKELEQEREDQKSKWQQFNNKAYSKNKKGQVRNHCGSVCWWLTPHRPEMCSPVISSKGDCCLMGPFRCRSKGVYLHLQRVWTEKWELERVELLINPWHSTTTHPNTTSGISCHNDVFVLRYLSHCTWSQSVITVVFIWFRLLSKLTKNCLHTIFDWMVQHSSVTISKEELLMKAYWPYIGWMTEWKAESDGQIVSFVGFMYLYWYQRSQTTE